MMLSTEQLQEVRAFFEDQSLSRKTLEDDLMDHCCSGVEELMNDQALDFPTAFGLMKQRLIPNGALEIEEDLKYLETYKPKMFMKKFVFASGYLSTLCLIAGVALIVMSFLRRESANMDRIQNEKEAIIMMYSQKNIDDPATQDWYRQAEMMSASNDLETLKSATNLFNLGQTLLILAICVFSVTILPYHFYSRYQRSMLELQHS